jgi:hypothetical protein
MGRVRVYFELVSKAEANDKPVGHGQSEPNRDPFLPNPKRELPPWAVYSRTVAYFAAMRGRLIMLAVILLAAFLAVPIIYITVSAQALG